MILRQSGDAKLPVRQWVLALPKRLRYFVHHDAALCLDDIHPCMPPFERATPVQIRYGRGS